MEMRYEKSQIFGASIYRGLKRCQCFFGFLHWKQETA